MVQFTTIDFRGPDRPGLRPEAAARQLEADVKAGAVGVGELNKNFGLTAKKTDGSRLKLDDPELDPIWQAAARLNIPVFIHTADPQEFFGEMNFQNERWLELALYPDRRWPSPPNPSFNDLMGERDRLFKRHPKTTFIAAHLGWHANDLARLGKMFDEMPNVHAEMGAVLYDIGRQPRFAHDFFVKYQDRLLFGKDSYQPDEFPYYWRVLETNDEYFDYYRDYHAFWKLYGIGLPDQVLRKLYYQNALKLVPGDFQGRLPVASPLLTGPRRCRARGGPRPTTLLERMAHYLVTGGAGFIGSHLVEELARRGERVRVVDSLITGKRQNLAHIPGVEFLHGDLAEMAVARQAVDGVDYVLHQAAIPSVPRSVEDPVTSNRANIDASLNLLVAARDAKVKRVVYAGSSSAYGNTPTLPKVETMPTAPLSPYALQKLVVEQYCQMFTDALRPGDGDHALLQRVRPAAGSVVALLRRDLAVHQRAAATAGGRRSTATASTRATSPTWPTWWTACCARATRRTWPAR